MVLDEVHTIPAKMFRRVLTQVYKDFLNVVTFFHVQVTDKFIYFFLLKSDLPFYALFYFVNESFIDLKKHGCLF